MNFVLNSVQNNYAKHVKRKWVISWARVRSVYSAKPNCQGLAVWQAEVEPKCRTPAAKHELKQLYC